MLTTVNCGRPPYYLMFQNSCLVWRLIVFVLHTIYTGALKIGYDGSATIDFQIFMCKLFSVLQFWFVFQWLHNLLSVCFLKDGVTI